MAANFECMRHLEISAKIKAALGAVAVSCFLYSCHGHSFLSFIPRGFNVGNPDGYCVLV